MPLILKYVVIGGSLVVVALNGLDYEGHLALLNPNNDELLSSILSAVVAIAGYFSTSKGGS